MSRAAAVATTVAAAATAFAALVAAAEAADQAAYYTEYNNGANNDTGNDRPFAISLGHTIIPARKCRFDRTGFISDAPLQERPDHSVANC